MAGRGRRLGGYGENEEPLRRPGEGSASLSNAVSPVTILTEKIDRLDVKGCDVQLINEIKAGFETLCPTEDSLIDVVKLLVDRVLTNRSFGHKLACSFAKLYPTPLGRRLQRPLICAMQYVYETTQAAPSVRNERLVNAVSFHGYIFNFIIRGTRFKVLAKFLLKYLECLLEGSEEQHKMIAKQMFLNGYHMSVLESEDFEAFKRSLRKTLVEKDLSSQSKCWVLLCIDYISNNFNPLQGVVRDFYLKEIGDAEYVELELTIDMSDRGVEADSGLYKLVNSLNIKTSPQEKPKEVQNKAKNDGRPLKGRGLRMGGKTQDFQCQKLKSKGETDEKSKRKEEMNSIPGTRHASNRKDDEFYGIQYDRESSVRVGKKILGRKSDSSDPSAEKSKLEDVEASSKGEEAVA